MPHFPTILPNFFTNIIYSLPQLHALICIVHIISDRRLDLFYLLQKINIKYQVYFIAWRFLFLSALKRTLQLLLREFIDIHVIETKYWTMQYKVQWNKKLNSILMIKIYSEPLRLRSIFTTCWARQTFPTFLWAITQFEELHVYKCSCASFGLWEISIAWRTQFLSCFDHFQGKVGAIFSKSKTGSIGKLKSAFIHVIVYSMWKCINI